MLPEALQNVSEDPIPQKSKHILKKIFKDWPENRNKLSENSWPGLFGEEDQYPTKSFTANSLS